MVYDPDNSSSMNSPETEKGVEVWFGEITGVGEDTFVARLEREGAEEHYAEIYKSTVRTEDIGKIEEDAQFLWTLTPKENGEPVSEITFLEIEPPTEEELTDVIRIAREERD